MLTPGVSVSRSSNLRPRIGVDSTATWLSVLADDVRVTSTGGCDHGHGFRDARDFHRRRQRDGLTDGQLEAVLRERGEAGEREGDLVVPGRQLQDREPAVAAGDRGSGEDWCRGSAPRPSRQAAPRRSRRTRCRRSRPW